MGAYTRINVFEREEISRGLALAHSFQKIAKCLKRPASTISREIKRNQCSKFDYRAIVAQSRAKRMAKKSRRQRKLDTNDRLLAYVQEHLEKRWSPEQIAKSLAFRYSDDMTMRVSHETIYAYLYVHPRGCLKRQMVQQLRRKHKHRRIMNKGRQKSSPIQDYISIDERPEEAKNREIAGHWEGDLMMGKMNKSAIGTLVERKTRLTILARLQKKDSPTVCKAFAEKLNHLPKRLKKSLTYDQGTEMADHKKFSQTTRIKVYFAHPHSPWERGTSENTNGLVRDFFPSGTDFSKVSDQQLQSVQDLLNDRPRKILNWHTPHEAFTKAVALEL
jgi:transposase, IS30 family